MTDEEAVSEALAWIATRLGELGIRFQVAGGLAAIAHGAERPLNDIDIYVPEDTLDGLAADLEAHVTRPPFRHQGPRWDCYFMELHYGGQEIEVAEAARTRYRRGEEHPWHEARVDFDRPEVRTVFGVEIPVMPLGRLLEYKRRLGRPVDREDVAALEGEAGGAIRQGEAT